MNVLVQILQSGNLIGVITNVSLDIALKLRALISSLGNDVTVNIHAVGEQAVALNSDTIATVSAWLAERGLPPLQITDPATPAPAGSSGENPAPAQPAQDGTKA